MSTRQFIFITGAASGIGRATAKRFGAFGWLVAATDVDELGLKSLRAELGADNCLARPLDVTDKADFDAAVAEFGEVSQGRLDLLFNNAGIGRGGFFEDVPHEEALRTIQTNFVGVVNGIYAALPLLKNTFNSLCFSTSSSSAIYGIPRLAVYAATKFAIKGLTEALSVEFEPHGVRVADVLPGVIDTAILNPALGGDALPDGVSIRDVAPKQGLFRLMPPESVAECVWNAYDDRTNRLHWYVPAELEELDRAKAAGAEAVRERVKSGSLIGSPEAD